MIFRALLCPVVGKERHKVQQMELLLHLGYTKNFEKPQKLFMSVSASALVQTLEHLNSLLKYYHVPTFQISLQSVKVGERPWIGNYRGMQSQGVPQ